MTAPSLRFPLFVRLLSVAALVLGAVVPPAAAAGNRIVVIKSKDLPPFDQAILEFKHCLAAEGVAATFEVTLLPNDPGAAESMIHAIGVDKPDMLLTLGGQASRLAREKQHKPSVFCMVLDPAASGLQKGGVSLDTSPSDYLDYLRKNFPQFKRIGILYNPVKSGEIVDGFRSLSLTSQSIVFEEVSDIGQLDGALRALKTKADCLLMIADSSIYNPRTASQIILQTIQMSLPFIALSGAFVKAGALAAIYADAADNGCQAAELAARALQGENPMEMPLLGPRKLGSAVNLVVADRLKVSVSQSARNAAEQVVQ